MYVNIANIKLIGKIMEEKYYYIKISNFWTIFWLVISILFIFGTEGKGFLIILYYDLLNKYKYYYNDDKLIKMSKFVDIFA